MCGRTVQIPVYVHAKEIVDPRSRRRTALEVNFMKFLAYNGAYKLFGFIPAGDLVRPMLSNFCILLVFGL